MRIVLFKGTSRYNLLSYWTDELSLELSALGANVITVDFSNKAAFQAEFLVALSKPADLFFSFNGVGGELEKEGVFDRLITPFWQYFCDNPYHHLGRLNLTSSFVFPSFTGQEHIDTFTSLYPNRTCFELPHAGSSSKMKASSDGKREIPCALFGSYVAPEEVKAKWQELPKHLEALLKQIVKRGFEENNFDPFDLIRQEFKDKKFIISSTHYQKLKLIYVQLEVYFRNYFRKKLIDHFEKEGIQIDLFGEGFDSLKTSFHRVHGPSDYGDMVEMLKNCQIVLGTCPVFPISSHERPLTAMLQGAVAVSEKNKFFKNAFSEDEMLFFSWDNLQKLSEQVKELLHNSSKRLAIAKRGQEKTASKYSYKELAKEVLLKTETLQALTRI